MPQRLDRRDRCAPEVLEARDERADEDLHRSGSLDQHEGDVHRVIGEHNALASAIDHAGVEQGLHVTMHRFHVAADTSGRLPDRHGALAGHRLQEPSAIDLVAPAEPNKIEEEAEWIGCVDDALSWALQPACMQGLSDLSIALAFPHDDRRATSCGSCPSVVIP